MNLNSGLKTLSKARKVWRNAHGLDQPTTGHTPEQTEKARLIEVLIRKRTAIEESPFSPSRKAILQAIEEVLRELGTNRNSPPVDSR